MEKIKFQNKSEFRHHSKEKLTKLHNTYSKDKRVTQEILERLKKLKIRSLLLYISLEIEVDMRKIITVCRRKYKVFVPFMEGVSFKVVKYRLPLYTKRFNIKEPQNSFAIKPKIDLAIVPIIGVDGAFKRIGFGKGMYDRFFESLSFKPTVWFVQREMCFTQTILSEQHDIEADIYLTPYKTMIKRGTNGFRVTSSRCRSSKRCCGVHHRQKDGSGKL
ncbi:MAG: 5-formyltetrahydrofolate cyclo-ligase [Sulfurospirillaceae bacterium]|nr:5-formyltetrahydrofolate cyclo-ligase [Sulfurospirillaceae bacterium]